MSWHLSTCSVCVCRKEWGIEWRVGLVFPQAALEHSEERYDEM